MRRGITMISRSGKLRYNVGRRSKKINEDSFKPKSPIPKRLGKEVDAARCHWSSGAMLTWTRGANVTNLLSRHLMVSWKASRPRSGNSTKVVAWCNIADLMKSYAHADIIIELVDDRIIILIIERCITTLHGQPGGHWLRGIIWSEQRREAEEETAAGGSDWTISGVFWSWSRDPQQYESVLCFSNGDAGLKPGLGWRQGALGIFESWRVPTLDSHDRIPRRDVTPRSAPRLFIPVIFEIASRCKLYLWLPDDESKVIRTDFAPATWTL